MRPALIERREDRSYFNRACFLGGTSSNLIVSVTVTGDVVCKATDKTYRLDTAAARGFLDDFVTVPSWFTLND